MASILEGRTAFVTGAAGGFGRVITRRLLEAGAAVVASDVDRSGLETLTGELEGADLVGRFTTHVLDVSDYSACVDAIALARTRNGSIDILVNNGAMGMGVVRGDHMSNLVTIDEISAELWDKFVAVNFCGAWYLTKAAQPHMKANGWGRIINVTTSFFTMLRGRFHPYGPAKAGLEAMSAGHAAEFEPDGITVNVVVPGGPSDTAMVPPEAPYVRRDLIPPAKMAPPILWLCSDAASGVTGKRYVAAKWDETLPVAEARTAAEAPIAWPGLADAPVWPGGKPKE